MVPRYFKEQAGRSFWKASANCVSYLVSAFVLANHSDLPEVSEQSTKVPEQTTGPWYLLLCLEYSILR